MQKKLLIGSLIFTSSLALANGTYAETSTNTTPGLPPEFSILSTSEINSLATMTDAERTAFLASKGITRPDLNGSGSITGQNSPAGLILTTAEKTALATMTDTERDAFFASKGLTRPTGTGTMDRNTTQVNRMGSGTTANRVGQNQTRQTHVTASTGTNTVTTGTTTTQSRADRIAQNQAKNLEIRKTKIQSKINAGESLTRLEKKFAAANGITQ